VKSVRTCLHTCTVESVIYRLRCRALNLREEQVRSLAERTGCVFCLHPYLTACPVHTSRVGGTLVASVHPLDFSCKFLFKLVCVYNGEHNNTITHTQIHKCGGGGRPRRGSLCVGWGWGLYWWWCKAVTEIEGDGVAAAGCSVHCQSGMINEWRPQLSLTFGEPHRTSAELSAL